MSLKVSIIFNERPQQWGLRGDPLLWDDLEQSFSHVPLPCKEEEFVSKVKEYFFNTTGHNLEETENFYFKQYDKGGMSSGYICLEVWKNELIPLLIQRLLKYNQ